MIAASAADLGSMLREARKAKKMSQTELAAMVGVSRQWVISAEKGAPTARVDLMLDALRCVDLLVDVVRDDTGDALHFVFGGGGG
ncbi:helix-turn-helix domain-containing protein [Mycolicibacterium sp.]|jgi:HTH-type transcriptional regulator/antitoxin HipB|uniref:helix-turn-helix transcriptional regulator n=1 Tax=Mycolicibacterium sp. TaxID=2320850 RepID=UPI0025DAE7CE|nr:helix-turn-helix domain-containing protein [Mycolicibacterium sp.]MCB9410205.1 helix-turn-helix domain-containing protein [Mycolicibacterium sp.]